MLNIYIMEMVEEIERAQLGVKLEDLCVGLLYMWMALYWWQTQWMELQTMLEVVQAYAMRWRMKFNSKMIMVIVGKREGGKIWKIDV